jgi:hypothetical protein
MSRYMPSRHRGEVEALLYPISTSVVGQRHAPVFLPPGKRPATHCIGGWVDLGANLDGSEKPRPTGVRSPDRTARSESLSRPPIFRKAESYLFTKLLLKAFNI